MSGGDTKTSVFSRGTLDVLTSLPDAEAFRDRVNSALLSSSIQGKSVAMIVLNLERFKEVNSLHGRAVGDQLLQSVASRFVEAAGTDAAMTSRVDGDEFAGLWLGLPDSTHLEPIARRLLQAISAPVRIGPFEIAPVPALGIVFCHRGDTDAGTMLKWATFAMYRARHEKTGYAFNNFQDFTQPKPTFRFGRRDG